jgi:hypothetical protein
MCPEWPSKMVGATGFEPATPCGQVPRSAMIRGFVRQAKLQSLIYKRICRSDPVYASFDAVHTSRLEGARLRDG